MTNSEKIVAGAIEKKETMKKPVDVESNELKCELCDCELSDGYVSVNIPKFGTSFICCAECAKDCFKVNF